MENVTVTLPEGATIDIEGGKLAIVSASETSITVTAEAAAPPPPPDPGEYLWLKRWQFKTAAGNPDNNLTGWTQAIGKVWYDAHDTMPQSPSGTCSIQGDRDYKGRDVWPDENPSTAKIWVTVDVPVATYSLLQFGLEEIHHLIRGTANFRVYGRNGAMVQLYEKLGTWSEPISKKTDPPLIVGPVNVPLPNGPVSQVKLEIECTLADEADGCLWGDIWVAVA